MNPSPPEKNSEFDDLRRLLLGPDLKKLEKLAHSLDSADKFSSEVGQVLPEAMLKSAKQGPKLSQAMVPTVEEIVRLSIKRDINKFANVLFPVIGPAIRKSIAETFRQMMQSLNQVLEYGLSWQGLKWRIESMRTGMPFAQIVLLHSLQYRVEQVFLIHKETGILLNHVELIDSQNQNADMVSSMLSAIGDFVGDSFDVKDRQALDSIQVGDFSIWIEQGPDAILAIAIRGDAPTSLRETMQQTVEEIQSQFEHELGAFKSNTAPFELCRDLLLGCMQSGYRTKQQKTALKTYLIGLVVVILFLYWLVSMLYLSIQQNDYVAMLEQEPGFILTQVSHQGDRLTIKGLRDPLARSPEKFIALSTLNPEDISLQFEPYQSLQPEFIQQRLHKILNPPPNVEMTFKNGLLQIRGFASADRITAINIMAPLIAGIERVDSSGLSSQIDLSSLDAGATVTLSLDIDNGQLVVTGTALDSWREMARQRALEIAGIRSYDDSRLQTAFDFSLLNPPEGVSMVLQDGLLSVTGRAASDWIDGVKASIASYTEISQIDLSQLINIDAQQLHQDIQALEREMIFFDVATYDTPGVDSLINQVVVLARKIIATANKLSIAIQLVVKGHSDSVGSYQDNAYLSKARAEYVAQYLFNSGISPDYIIIEGLDGAVEKERSAAEQRFNRRVSFKVLSKSIDDNVANFTGH